LSDCSHLWICPFFVRGAWNSPRGRTAPKPARMPVGRNR
jgi:hypothetical protein